MAKPFHALDRLLLVSFIARELRDFAVCSRMTEGQREDKVIQVITAIEADLKDRNDYWSITFESMSNMGYRLRCLELAGHGDKPSTSLQCIFDTAVPGRFVIQSPDSTGIKDMPALFPAKP